MPRPARLSRESIISAAEAILGEDGSISMARLGARLGVDPSALYRWFDSRDELLRAVGDRSLIGITGDLPADDDWRVPVGELCRRLRAAHLRHPDLSALISDRPPLQPNEIDLTDALLGLLSAAGFPPVEAALAYHALIECSVGSALLDAPLQAMDDRSRAAEYDDWRERYSSLSAETHPHVNRLAAVLYRGSADDRFDYMLGSLLAGLESERLRRPA